MPHRLLSDRTLLVTFWLPDVTGDPLCPRSRRVADVPRRFVIRFVTAEGTGLYRDTKVPTEFRVDPLDAALGLSDAVADRFAHPFAVGSCPTDPAAETGDGRKFGDQRVPFDLSTFGPDRVVHRLGIRSLFLQVDQSAPVGRDRGAIRQVVDRGAGLG